MFEYEARVDRVIDGDTIVVTIDLGFTVTVIKTVRIAKIDAYETRLGRGTTPEMKAKGLEGKNYLIDLIQGDVVKVRTFKDKGKYGRFVADVIYKGKDIGKQMVKLGYAVEKEY